MTDPNNLLFTYGTLQDEPENPYAQLVFDEGEPFGDAYFNGRLFDIGGYHGAVDSKDPRDKVMGHVHRLKDPSILEKYLDEYEGCAPGNTEPTEFIRAERNVFIASDGRKLRAWIYLYNLDTVTLERIPGSNYLQDLTES